MTAAHLPKGITSLFVTETSARFCLVCEYDRMKRKMSLLYLQKCVRRQIHLIASQSAKTRTLEGKSHPSVQNKLYGSISTNTFPWQAAKNALEQWVKVSVKI
ncbi:hypothetical protein TNIN_272721 [Trichonephila inaurata madagascariensis]|uniref:Uncharacterized protein n=1 Tax=Trichonephila inaurata madagascariensis TaxID=2747483 RepID=A0A8X6Y000_9ARAC|nr:hypothetical protein TNIN_272721 [Trichonephila inaurata madagascariensis]